MGYRVFNKETQQYIGASAEQLPQLLSSGKFALDPSEKYKAAVPGGDLFDVNPNTDFSKALEDGLTFEPDAQRDLRIRKEQASEYPGVAAAVGALRGATAGLSDVAFRGLDEAAQKFTGEQNNITQFIGDIKEANPTASTLGEIGGTVASLAVPVSAPSLIGKAGVAATEATATALGVNLGEKAVAGQLAKRAFAKGLGSAIEGAFYGAGQTVSEAALGDPEEAAQNLIANVGAGAFFGGTIGALPQFVGDVYRGKVGGFTRKQVAEGIEAVDKLNELTKGFDESELTKAINKDFFIPGASQDLRQMALEYTRDPNQALRKVVDGIDESFQASNQFSRAISNDAKTDLIENFGKAQGAEAKKAATFSAQVLKDTSDDIKNILSQPEADLLNKKVLKNIDLVSRKHKTALSDIARKGEEATVGDSFKALDAFRKDFDKIAKPYLEKKDVFLNVQEQNTKQAILNLRARLKDSLVDENQFGILGSTNKQINKAVSEFINLNKEVRKKFGEKNPVTGQYVISPSKMKSFFSNPADIRNTLKQELFEKWAESSQNLIKVARENNLNQFLQDLPEQTLNLLENAQAIKKRTEDIRGAMIGLHAMQPTTGAKLSGAIIGNSIGAAVGGAVGTLFGGPVAGVVGAAAGTAAGHLISSPVTRWRILAKMERAVINNQNEVAEKVNRFFNGIPLNKKVKASGTRAGALDTFSQMINEYNENNTDDKRLKRVKDTIKKSSIPQMMTGIQNINPELYATTIQNKLQGVNDAAPGVGSQLAAANIRGMEFLRSKVAPNTLADLDITPNRVKYMPSQAEQTSFKRYVESVMEPMQTLDRLAEGRLQREHVEALQVVYPQLYKQIQQQVVSAITNMEKDVPYQKKLQVAVLMGVPTVAAMNPQYLAEIQNSYALQNGQQGARMGAKPIQMNTAVNGLTATQQAMT